MRVKEESERAALRLNIKKIKTVESSPNTAEKVEVVTDFLFLGSKITADSDCSREIRRQLLLGRKPVTNPDSVLKNRHYSADNGLYSHSYGFLSDHIWELDSKEGRMPKNWCLWTVWCWRRLLRVAWTARRSNQSILREINPEYSREGLMLKLKLQYFGHLMQTTHWKSPWCWERLRAEAEESIRGWDGWMASLMQWTWTWANSGRRWGTGRPGVLQSMGSQGVGKDWVTEQQQQQEKLEWWLLVG